VGLLRGELLFILSTIVLAAYHRNVLKIRALILSRLGLTQEEIGEELDRPRTTIETWLTKNNGAIFPSLTEEVLQEASRRSGLRSAKHHRSSPNTLAAKGKAKGG
jgi:hypothetical protein